jgi:hypothetical protein
MGAAAPVGVRTLSRTMQIDGITWTVRSWYVQISRASDAIWAASSRVGEMMRTLILPGPAGRRSSC